jgi:hypothetical protein
MCSFDSIFNYCSSESAICYRQRLVVSVGNFQRAKHEMFITASSAREWRRELTVAGFDCGIELVQRSRSGAMRYWL